MLYPGKARRHKSKKYKEWEKEAGLHLIQQRGAMFKRPVVVSIFLVPPDTRIRDLTNYEKAVNDLLVKMLVLEDDSLIHEFYMRWATSGPPCLVYVEEI